MGVEGKLVDLTPQGLLFHGDKTLKSLICAWPQFLLYLSICEQVGAAPFLLLTDDGTRLAAPTLNPVEALGNYLEYFHACLAAPSPLLPAWATAFLEKTEEELIERSCKVWKQIRARAYLKWLDRRGALIKGKRLLQSGRS